MQTERFLLRPVQPGGQYVTNDETTELMRKRDRPMRIVSGKFVVAMLLTAMCLGASFVEAAAPGKGKNEKDGKNDGKNGSVTVSEVELKAKLAGAGTQTAATGYAESGIVTVTNKTTKVTTTKSSLTVSVKGLTLA
ncbi:MAG: hypothetical protein JWM11_7052, partial [Planctomycetaceae bacterium]|nr:hypothetical protein [Planctomycetaceae bacterium]